MSDLKDVVREIIAELDPDGGGFRTTEATDRLFARAKAEPYIMGPLTAALAKLGCNIAIKQHRPDTQLMSRAYVAAAESIIGAQRDMSEIADDFGWVNEHVALSEGDGAVRKLIFQLTLAETKQVIALKRRKANQALAMAIRLQHVVDNRPEWEDDPTLSLGEILRLNI